MHNAVKKANADPKSDVHGLSASIGICTLQEANWNPDQMKEIADKRMYDLKQARRDVMLDMGWEMGI